MADHSPAATIETRRKRLKIRAWRRGTREMDLILGGYADAHLPTMTEAELDLFEAALEVEDPPLYDWILGRADPPDDLAPLVMSLARHAGRNAS